MQDNRNIGLPATVVPAKAGTQETQGMDPRIREDDALFHLRWVVVSPTIVDAIRNQGNLQNDGDARQTDSTADSHPKPHGQEVKKHRKKH
jgi:hypothetical protein